MPLIEIDDVNYHFLRQGDGPPLLLLHGFTGSKKSWTGFAEALAQSYDVVSIDLLGHGGSDCPAAAQRYAIEHAAQDITALAKKLGFELFSLLGYSMGGRLALYLAHRYPKSITRLILESASPGIAGAAARQQRRSSDSDLADSIEKDGIRDFVDRWQRLPLFASQAAVSQQRRSALREQRLRNSTQGLANSLRGMGTGSQPSLWRELPDITVPSLLLCGELDTKYVRIGQEMASLLPHASLKIVPDTGHNVHFERPSGYAAIVSGFLKQAPLPRQFNE